MYVRSNVKEDDNWKYPRNIFRNLTKEKSPAVSSLFLFKSIKNQGLFKKVEVGIPP